MKKYLSLFLAALMLFCCVSSCLAETYPEGTLYRGIKGHKDEVEFLQYQLFYGGYLGDDINEVDGVFGKKTESAVKAFQKDHNLKQTGVVDAETKRLLDEAWENSMEPQEGDDSSYCYMEHYANGTQSMVLCSSHMQIYAEAADAINQAGQRDDEIVEGLQTGITFWMEELESLYRQWKDLRPEYAQQITAHQEAFMDYYRAQLAVWNAYYGSPSMAALEKAMSVLSDRCVELCSMIGPELYVGGSTYSAMMVTNCESAAPFYLYDGLATGKVFTMIPVNTILRNCSAGPDGMIGAKYKDTYGYVSAEYMENYTDLMRFPRQVYLNYGMYDKVNTPQEPALKCAWKKDFALGYNYGEYVQDGADEYAAEFVLYSDSIIGNVHVFSLDMLSMDDASGIISFAATIEHIQYTVDWENPLRVVAYIDGAIPNMAVGYEDAQGVYHFAFVEISGEDGSLLLNEF